MGKDKISCSSEWLIAGGVRSRADTDTVIASTKRIGTRAALSPLNLTSIGSGYADNKVATRPDETLFLLLQAKLSNSPNASHQLLAGDKTRLSSSSNPVIADGC